MFKRSTVIFIAFLLCGTECEKSDKSTSNLESIKINDSIRKPKVDTVYTLDFETIPENYSAKVIKWKSSNDSIISIERDAGETCKIKFLKPGKAKITVSVDGKKNSKTFKVGSDFSFTDFLMWFSIIGFVVCFLIHWKFGDKIINKKILYFLIAILIFILLFSLFKIIRIVVYAITGAIFVGIFVYYFIKKIKEKKIPIHKKKKDKSKNELNTEDLGRYLMNFLCNKENIKLLHNLISENEQLCSSWVEISLDNDKINGILKDKLVPGPQIENAENNQKCQGDIEIARPSSSEEQSQYKNDDVNTTTLYADSIFDGFFNKTSVEPNEDTIFELHLETAQNAKFTIYQPAEQRIISRNSFLDGCDKQVLANAHIVEIICEGTAQLNANGKWKILNKLNVIIK